MVPNKTEEYLLQYNEVIEINITASDPLLNTLFDINRGGNQGRMMMGGGMMNGGDIFYLTGYTFNEAGIVEHPVIEKVKIVGMNTYDAKIAIENELKKIGRDNEYFVG